MPRSYNKPLRKSRQKAPYFSGGMNAAFRQI